MRCVASVYNINVSIASQFILKGPKLEIFGSGVFTQIRLVWVLIGDLGTRPTNPKLGWFRPENHQFILFSAVGYNTEDFLTL
jgi:hypothetical protein